MHEALFIFFGQFGINMIVISVISVNIAFNYFAYGYFQYLRYTVDRYISRGLIDFTRLLIYFFQ